MSSKVSQISEYLFLLALNALRWIDGGMLQDA